MRTIHLYGLLGRTFGRSFRLDVKTPAEAVKALGVQLKGFAQMIRDGRWKVVSGHPTKGMHYPNDVEALHFRMGKKGRDLHIIPVIVGAGGKTGAGVFVVIGLTLIAATLFAGPMGFASAATALSLAAEVATFAYNATLALGASLALQGIGGLLTKTTKAVGGKTDDEASRRESLLFGSLAEGTQQGRPVPIVYGVVRVTGVPISIGMSVEDF